MTVEDERITLHRYDPSWPARFDEEAAALRAVAGKYLTGGVHHVGSTAIPGMTAKPIIDIMAGVDDLESSRPCIELVGELGYLYAPYRADVMHWFCKPDPSRRTHHLHLVPTGSERFLNVLAFRDYLRADPEAAAEYEALKRDLALRFPADRDAYTEGKEALVLDITARARSGPAAG